MHLILFGFKGSGKSYFGRLVACQLNIQFIDTDDLILSQHTPPLSISQIYQNLGETAFRSTEAKAIKSMRLNTPSVIALGGGTFLTHDLIAFLQQIGSLIYLEASFATIAERLLKNELPSFVDPGSPLESLFEIYQKRKPLYESIPAYKIHTDSLNDASIISEICSLWSSHAL